MEYFELPKSLILLLNNQYKHVPISFCCEGVAAAVKIPVIAAGGFYSGRSMLAGMVLGADAVQFGTRFVACQEATSHQAFKDAVVKSKEGWFQHYATYTAVN